MMFGLVVIWFLFGCRLVVRFDLRLYGLLLDKYLFDAGLWVFDRLIMLLVVLW